MSGFAAQLTATLRSYAAARALSARQEQVLYLFLTGKVNYEIAHSLGCSTATIYEHWQRMATKSGGRRRRDVIADFHRFASEDAGAVPDESAMRVEDSS